MTNQLWGPFHITPNCRIWVAEDRTFKDATESELAKSFSEARLTNREVDRWNRYRPLEKKRQFLNSRLVIRSVLNSEFGTDSASLIMDSLESGQPILVNSHGSRVANVSLSHTRNITTIALSDTRYGLGVDIETIQPLNERAFGLSFINQFEREQMEQEGFIDNLNAMLAIWTLKEAFWKALGGPPQISLGDIVVDYSNAILNPNVPKTTGKKDISATQFFGHGYSFPGELRNYSAINVPESDVSAFVGCVVTIDARPPENAEAPDNISPDRQR